MVALNGGKPELMTLIDMLKAFVAFREDVITRRTKYLLAQGARPGACAWLALPSRLPISTKSSS
jgi:hypothetical protein